MGPPVVEQRNLDSFIYKNILVNKITLEGHACCLVMQQ